MHAAESFVSRVTDTPAESRGKYCAGGDFGSDCLKRH